METGSEISLRGSLGNFFLGAEYQKNDVSYRDFYISKILFADGLL